MTAHSNLYFNLCCGMKPNAWISESLLLIKISVIVIACKQFFTLRDTQREFFLCVCLQVLKNSLPKVRK